MNSIVLVFVNLLVLNTRTKAQIQNVSLITRSSLTDNYLNSSEQKDSFKNIAFCSKGCEKCDTKLSSCCLSNAIKCVNKTKFNYLWDNKKKCCFVWNDLDCINKLADRMCSTDEANDWNQFLNNITFIQLSISCEEYPKGKTDCTNNAIKNDVNLVLIVTLTLIIIINNYCVLIVSKKLLP
jgi:hypothetical protein